jgi:hypothetical protein
MPLKPHGTDTSTSPATRRYRTARAGEVCCSRARRIRAEQQRYEGLRRERGAIRSYSDPHVPQFPKMREHRFGLASLELTAQALSGQDCVVLVTDHDRVATKRSPGMPACSSIRAGAISPRAPTSSGPDGRSSEYSAPTS